MKMLALALVSRCKICLTRNMVVIQLSPLVFFSSIVLVLPFYYLLMLETIWLIAIKFTLGYDKVPC